MPLISSVSRRCRNSFIAAMTYGWELNVPRAKQMSAGRSSRKRFMKRARPHTTPTGKPPPSVLP